MVYNYDLAGDVSTWTHPEGFTITNTIGKAQRVTQITSSLADSTQHPQDLAQSITYAPHGAVSTLLNGCAGSGCTPALETYSYNNRLQVSEIQLGTSANASADYSLTHNYYLPGGNTPPGCPVTPSGSGNNGNVIGYTYTDAVNNNPMSHSALYVYDTLNRLLCAQATSPNNNTAATYNLAFSYDRYGNMACSQNANTNGPCPQWAYNAGTNQLSTSTGCAYDAAGNLTTDCSISPTHAYTWDGEGRVASVDPGTSPTWSFTYNALGDRAQWAYGSSGAADQHWFDPAGNWLGNAGEFSTVRFGDRLLSVYLGSETYLYHMNNLNSTTMTTNHSGTWVDDALFYPWGETWKYVEDFAGLPYYDTKTTNDFAAFRVYSPNIGRWFSPDSVRGDVTNPQSLNLYPYVTDNPTTLTDPSGLCGCGGGGSGFGGGGGGWGGGCGGGGFGGFGGGRRRPPSPPIIPIPGPATDSIAGGGLFSDPFSFAQDQESTPWFQVIVWLPLPPWPPSPPVPPAGGGGSSGSSLAPGPSTGTTNCTYYLGLIATGDSCDRAYGEFAYPHCVGFGNGAWANCVRGCLIRNDKECRRSFASCILRDSCRQGAHVGCYSGCFLFGGLL